MNKTSPIFLFALLFFGLSQIVFGCSVHRLNLDLVQYADRFDFDGTVNGIKELNQPPTTIFLGSSLFRYLIWELNEKSSRRIDVGSRNGKSGSRMPDASWNLSGSKRYTPVQSHVWLAAKDSLGSNYSFAIAGAMMSDFNLIFQKYAPSNITNDVVFVECSPRSFYDSGIRPTATPVFRYFCELSDVLQPESDFFMNDSEGIKWLVNSLLPMSRYRQDIQEVITNGAGTVLERAAIISAKPAQTQRSFVASVDPTKIFEHSVEEYRGRYAGINKADVAIQVDQLKKLTQGIHERKALPVLLVMPLTTENLRLLPANFYNEWHRSMVTLASQQRCRLLDFSTGAFTTDDFYDCAHLNVHGGEKLLQMLDEENIVCADPT